MWAACITSSRTSITDSGNRSSFHWLNRAMYRLTWYGVASVRFANSSKAKRMWCMKFMAGVERQ